ncbi:MAG: Tol-Pal system beta propeller repeat protein TolB [Thermodesulfobacteriota bacterium]
MNIRCKQAFCRIFPLILLFFLVMGGRCFAQYDYINISEPFLKKIPLAVPEFKTATDSDAAKKTAERAAEMVSRSLAFTGYFKVIDRDAFLERPKDNGITADAVNFKNWTDIGTELLITGGIRLESQVLQMEFRLFDPFRGELLVGKRYTGDIGDLRKMSLKFSRAVISRLTGDTGIFNSRIAFVSAEKEGKFLYVCDFDGHNPHRVTDAQEILLFPSWSPDGRSLAYTSYQEGSPDIYIQSLSGKNQAKVISFAGVNIAPAWVPGQSKIAATLSHEGDEEIYLLTPKGKIVKRITNSWGVDVSPTFSPDAKFMAFVSNRSGSPQIYIRNMENGDTRRLTFKGKYNTQPDWSPSGDKIVYSGMQGGRTDIYVIDTDGGERKQLTREAGNNESPSWSPDGSLIVFSSTRNGSSDIFVMTASGTDQRPLLDLPGKQSLPAWSPPINP